MSILVQVTSGNGPVECCWVVWHVALALERDAAQNGAKLVKVEETPGDYASTFRSVVFSLNTDTVPRWLLSWVGTIQWIGESPFRPGHGRKNWFVGVQLVKQPDYAMWSLEKKDVKIKTFRSSGKGGQNVNKVSTAVRITHLATGKSVAAQNQRSQYQNRKSATERLQGMLQQENENRERVVRNERWLKHYTLVRGAPVKIYTGVDFRPVAE